MFKILLLAGMSLFASTAFAQLAPPKNPGLPETKLPEMILQLVNYILILVGVLALAYLVYGGFLYITSHGESQQVEKAKGIIVYAIIGIVVIGLAAAVVTFVIQGMVGG